MKKLLTLTLVGLFVFIISPQELLSQKKEKKATLEFKLEDDSGQEHWFTVSSNSFVTPSGNLLRSYKIKVPESVMENISFEGYANKIIGVEVSNIENSGNSATGYGYLNKSGNLTINLHINGAGNLSPKGWF